MGDRLQVDTAELRRTGEALRFLRSELAQAEQIANDPGILGHARLSEKVSSFARNWAERRAEMLDAIRALDEAAVRAGETYDEIEQGLVAGLKADP